LGLKRESLRVRMTRQMRKVRGEKKDDRGGSELLRTVEQIVRS